MDGPLLSSKEMIDSDEEDSSDKDTLFRGKVKVQLGSYLSSTRAIDSVESIRIRQFGKPIQKESASDRLLKQATSISEKSDARDERDERKQSKNTTSPIEPATRLPVLYKTLTAIAPTHYKTLDVLSPIVPAELKQRRFIPTTTLATPQSNHAQKRRRRESSPIVIDLSKSDTETEVEEVDEDDDDDETEVEIIEDDDDDDDDNTEVEVIEDDDEDDIRRYSTKKRDRRSR